MLNTFKAGFKFEEKQTGTYHLFSRPEEEKAFTFTAQAAVDSVLDYLRDMSATLQGTVEMEGFADQVPLNGSLELNPLLGRVLRYQFTFVANDGKTYRFAGQKDIQLLDLPGSMTTLPGVVYDETGNEIARVLTRFDLGSDLVPFLLSWRPVLPFLG
jgi:hypothetical protein